MSEEIKSNTYGGDGGNEFAQSLNLPLTQDANTPISQEKTTNELLDEIERYEQSQSRNSNTLGSQFMKSKRMSLSTKENPASQKRNRAMFWWVSVVRL